MGIMIWVLISPLLDTPGQLRRAPAGLQRFVAQPQLWEPRQVGQEPAACFLICTVASIVPTCDLVPLHGLRGAHGLCRQSCRQARIAAPVSTAALCALLSRPPAFLVRAVPRWATASSSQVHTSQARMPRQAGVSLSMSISPSVLSASLCDSSTHLAQASQQ